MSKARLLTFVPYTQDLFSNFDLSSWCETLRGVGYFDFIFSLTISRFF